MKRFYYVFLILGISLAAGLVWAENPETEDAGCPAARAGKHGFDLLKDLHHVMAPAWHKAYPEKDCAVIREAVVKFDAMLPKVKEMNPAFKLTTRQEKFNAARTNFITLVEQGKTANDSVLLANMPTLHTNFEEMAYYVLPLEYPEFASLQTVVALMVDTHLKNGDYDAIRTSSEALKIKNDQLQKAVLPEDMKPVEKEAKSAISGLDASCQELISACAGKDGKKMDDCLKKLQEACIAFQAKFI